MGIEDAYVALPPLLQASFSTTCPATTFVSLVNFTLRSQDFRPEELGCDGYYALLRLQLEAKSSLFAGSLPDSNSPTEGDELSFLGHSAYKQIVKSTPKHVIYPLGLRYLELVAKDPHLETFLFHPYRADVRALLEQEFLPPLTVIRLHHELLRARDTLIYVNPTLHDM